jgi:hypothetical protein
VDDVLEVLLEILHQLILKLLGLRIALKIFRSQSCSERNKESLAIVR